ncbi:MAG: hypothetical protein IJ311_04970 [Elusimicrobiaceae bacterium]|nr:hypothetical protein [Elusimicrobiaceae bacterium]
MSELVYLWTIAQLFWVYCIKLKPLPILAFLLVHGILFWVLIAFQADFEPIIFRYNHRQNPLMMLMLLWSGGLIFLVSKICDHDLKTSREKDRKKSHQKPRS